MAITMIRDLSQKGVVQSFRVRVIQVWDQPAWARKARSKEFIIMDEQGDKVQMPLELSLVDRFDSLLGLSSTVLIRNFTVGSFPSKYATLSYIAKRVVISEKSLVTGFLISKVHLMVLLSLAFQRSPRTDVIGFLTRREQIHTYEKNGTEKQRVAVELMDPNGHVVRCAFFGECALEADRLFELNTEPKPAILIVQFAKINEYQDSLSLINAYHGTRIFYNSGIREMVDLRASLGVMGLMRQLTVYSLSVAGFTHHVVDAKKGLKLLMKTIVPLPPLSWFAPVAPTVHCCFRGLGWI